MTKISKLMAMAIIHSYCLIAFASFSFAQSVKINEIQGCFAPGTPVTLTAQGVTGASEYLRCFEWTSSTGEIINNDWMLMVTVTPQVTTSYILSVMEAGTPIASDTIRISVIGLDNFELPCVVDVKDGPTNVADIADHQGDCCDVGFTYTPAQLSLPTNVAIKTVQVTVNCGNNTKTKEVILINSGVTIEGLALSASSDGKIKITDVSGGVGAVYSYKGFKVIKTTAEKIKKAVDKLPFPTPLSIKSLPTISASGSINSTYMECQEPDCVKTKTKVEIGGGVGGETDGISIDLGEYDINIPIYRTPIVSVTGDLNFLGKLSAGVSGANTCEGGEICGRISFDISVQGGVSAVGGPTIGDKGLIEANLSLITGIRSNGKICLLVPEYELKPSLNLGINDLKVRGRVALAWGFAQHEINYTCIKGFDLIKLPSSNNN